MSKEADQFVLYPLTRVGYTAVRYFVGFPYASKARYSVTRLNSVDGIQWITP